jgi:hypothetical protein
VRTQERVHAQQEEEIQVNPEKSVSWYICYIKSLGLKNLALRAVAAPVRARAEATHYLLKTTTNKLSAVLLVFED